MHRVSSGGSESDWIEPSVDLCNSRSIGIDTVYDAFHMLQNDQAIKVKFIICWLKFSGKKDLI